MANSIKNVKSRIEAEGGIGSFGAFQPAPLINASPWVSPPSGVSVPSAPSGTSAPSGVQRPAADPGSRPSTEAFFVPSEPNPVTSAPIMGVDDGVAAVTMDSGSGYMPAPDNAPEEPITNRVTSAPAQAPVEGSIVGTVSPQPEASDWSQVDDLTVVDETVADNVAERVVEENPASDDVADSRQGRTKRTPTLEDTPKVMNEGAPKSDKKKPFFGNWRRKKPSTETQKLIDRAAANNSEDMADPMMRPVSSALKAIRDFSVNTVKAMWSGSAIAREITGNPRMKFSDVGLPVSMMVYQLRNEPNSYLAEILMEYNEGLDIGEMLRDDVTAESIIYQTFENNIIYGLVEKTVHDETTTHRRRIRVHYGTSIQINPLIAKQFNADFDGDQLKVTYRPEMVGKGKSPMAYLLGTEGGLRIDPDFMSFLPMYGDLNKVMDEVLGMIDGLVFNERHRDIIKEAFVKAWSGNTEEGLMEILTSISEAAINMYGDTEKAYEVAGSALETIYLMNEKILKASNLIKKYERSADLAERAMKRYAEEGVTAGNFSEVFAEPSPNSIAAQSTINAPAGMSGGRNVQFRITAGLGKLVRLSSNILGQDAAPTKLAQRTFLHILALQMSSVREFDQTGTDLGAMVDKWILDIIPAVPANYKGDKFSKFTESFVAAGRNVAMIINSAGLKVTHAGEYSKSDDFYMAPVVSPADFGKATFAELTADEKKEVSNSFRKMFRQVYGGMKMRHLFGKNPLIAQYKDMTLNEFIYRNDFTIKETGDATDDILGDVDVLIYRLADMNSSYAQSVYKAWDATVDAQFIHKKGVIKLADGTSATTKIAAILYRLGEKADPELYHEDLILLTEALRDIWPEMFDFLGLNAPFAFKQTALGQKFINARTKDQFKAALIEAVIMYKFDPIFEAHKAYAKAMEDGRNDDAAEAYELKQIELDALADTGYTWKMVVDLYRDNKDELTGIFAGKRGGTEIVNELLSRVVSGAYRTRFTKEQVVADIFSNPKNPSSDDRFVYGEGHGQILKNLKSSADRMSTYDQYGIYNLSREVSRARAQHGNNVVLFFRELSEDKSYFSSFSEATIVEAVTSIMEKTYDQTEKAQQSKIARFLYSIVSYIKNGGVLSHMTFGGDLSVNEMSLEKFSKSPWLLARILTEPGFSIDVYDRNGNISEISMESVLGVSDIGPDHSDLIWNWMSENPRAAMAFRISGMASGIGENGSDYTTASSNLSDSIETVLSMSPYSSEARLALESDPKLARDVIARRGMTALSNRPGFYSLVSMTIKMDTERRFQARNNALYGPNKDAKGTNVARVIEVIRSYYDHNGIVNDGLIESDIDLLFRDKFTPEEVETMNWLLKEKEKQDDERKAGQRVPDSRDVTLEPLFQIAQIKQDMERGLKRYAAELAKENMKTQVRSPNGALVSEGRIPPVERYLGPAEDGIEITGTVSQLLELSDLFLVDNPATRRAYFNVAETISNVKTELDTGVNGAESRNYVSLMFLADLVTEPCDAPPPTESISVEELGMNWHKYTDRVARINDKLWVPIGSETFERIAELSMKQGDGKIWLEVPGRCTAGSCPCKRHATADQSTNFRTKQTPALVRLVTIVRTLSAEGLNLKSKTKGIDDLDSIIKNEIDNPLYKEVSKRVKQKVNDEFLEVLASSGDQSAALEAARLVLAKHLVTVFKSMKYENNEMRLNDFVNVAQTMVKLVDGDTDSPSVVVLSLGRINAIVGSALDRLRAIAREEGVELSHDDYMATAEAAINNFDPRTATTSARSLLFHMKVPKVSPMAGKVRSDWNNSSTRRVWAISDLIETLPVRLRAAISSESKLNEAEAGIQGAILAKLDDDHPFLLEHESMAYRWRRLISRGTKYIPEAGISTLRDPKDRVGLRLTGLYVPGADEEMRNLNLKGIGDQNVVVISSESDYIVEAISDAYHLGNTVIIDGTPSPEIWEEVSRRTGGFIDANQGSFIESEPDIDGKVTPGYYIPMLDLRMNGRNTTDRRGGHRIGVYKQDGEKHIKFWVESVINPHRAGDGEFIATAIAKMTEHFRESEYRVRAEDLFHNAMRALTDSPDALKIVPQAEDADLVIGIAGADRFMSYEAFRAFMEDHLDAYQEGRVKQIIVTNANRTQSYVTRWASAVGISVDVISANGADQSDFIKRDFSLVERSDRLITFSASSSGRYDHADDIEGKAKSKGKSYAQIDHKGNKRIFGKSKSTGQWSSTKPTLLKNLYNQELNPPAVSGIEKVTVVPVEEVQSVIVEAIRSGQWGGVNVDAGTPLTAESEVDRVRLDRQLVRFADRVDAGSLTEDGWLDSVQSGEIVAILKIDVVGSGPIYHPLRAYEHSKQSGAPTDMAVSGVSFDQATGNIVVNWVHEGNMLGRFFKVFEYGNASVKLMARAEHIADIILNDGTKLFGYLSKMSTATRRLEWRRTQKMQTLIYKSRLQPFGYNIADSGALVGEPDLREMVLSGNSDIEVWANRLVGPEIVFFGDPEIDRIMNYMAKQCVKFGVDPTVMFASHHYIPRPGTENDPEPDYVFAPNDMWFDFQVVLGGDTLMPSIFFMDGLMKMMHRMNPELCPEGIDGEYRGEMLFNNDLQVFMPIESIDGDVYGEWVDMFGGPHFMDNHYYGYSASGTRVASAALASLPALLGSGAKLDTNMIDKLLDWGNIGVENRRYANRSIVTYTEDPED